MLPKTYTDSPHSQRHDEEKVPDDHRDEARHTSFDITIQFVGRIFVFGCLAEHQARHHRRNNDQSTVAEDDEKG